MTIPKEVRFDLAEGDGAPEGDKKVTSKSKATVEEMEIEFSPEPQPLDKLSALSRSIGKQWADDKSLIVWETNNEGIDPEEENLDQGSPGKTGYGFEPDQEAVEQLQEKMRARESDDTNSIK